MPRILKAAVARQGYQKPQKRSTLHKRSPFIPERNFFFKTFFAIFNQGVENRHPAVSEGVRCLSRRSHPADRRASAKAAPRPRPRPEARILNRRLIAYMAGRSLSTRSFERAAPPRRPSAVGAGPARSTGSGLRLIDMRRLVAYNNR